jgi:hypothetical protein
MKARNPIDSKLSQSTMEERFASSRAHEHLLTVKRPSVGNSPCRRRPARLGACSPKAFSALTYLLVTSIMAFACTLSPALAQDTIGAAEPLDQLFLLKDTKTFRISSYDRKGGNTDFVWIPPGKTVTLADIPNAGVIRRFYIAFMGPDRMRWRKMVLRMYWDGEASPAVEVPLGDFFGAGLGALRYFQSLAVSINPSGNGLDTDEDGLTSYLPMPFERGARITVENDGEVVDNALFYHLEYEQYASGQLPANAGRLHAEWRRNPHTAVSPGTHKSFEENGLYDKNTTGDNNFVILDAKGKGSLVGMFLTVDNSQGGWYGEGDDMIFVDGERWPPSYVGTGHEEVFDEGCCPTKEFSGPYTGFYLIENRGAPYGGFNQMYRFSINNPVHFQKSIRVTIEHGSANNYQSDYTSTAFWYQQHPGSSRTPLPSAEKRVPVWPDGVAAAIATEARMFGSWRQTEQDSWIRPADLHLKARDEKAIGKLAEAMNVAFKSLHYRDYIRDVREAAKILKRYDQKAEKGKRQGEMAVFD